MDAQGDAGKPAAASEILVDPTVTPPVSLAFLIVVFAVAIAAGAVIAYYGFSGHLGAGVP